MLMTCFAAVAFASASSCSTSILTQPLQTITALSANCLLSYKIYLFKGAVPTPCHDLTE
jgi:hypothetical protein